LLYGEIYFFGGFYRPRANEDPRKQDYLGLTKRLIEMGCDGIKFYDAKPSVRKILNMAIDAPEFEDTYSYIEEMGLPMVNHVGDPANFWDGEDAPAIAKQFGWTYDSTYVHPEQYFEEISNVFNRHPKLNMILSHLFFLSVDMPRLEGFLNDYPSIMVDVSPGTEMYDDFTNEPDAWNEFFTKYQDRILFGTDNGFYGEIPYEINVIRTFLETRNEFNAWERRIHGIGLDEVVLRKIYYDNFKGLVKQPRTVNLTMLADEFAYVSELVEESELKAEWREDMKDIKDVLVKMGVMK